MLYGLKQWDNQLYDALVTNDFLIMNITTGNDSADVHGSGCHYSIICIVISLNCMISREYMSKDDVYSILY